MTDEENTAGFPRQATRELIAAHERRGKLREGLQVLVFAVALAAFALALPHERCAGRGFDFLTVHIQGDWDWWLALDERTRFLVSALSVAGTFAVVQRLARARGPSARAALLIAALFALAPTAWNAARLPGPEARGMLGAAILFSALRENASGRSLTARVLLACALDPACLALAPAAILARRSTRVPPQVAAVLVAALSFVLLARLAGNAIPAALYPRRGWAEFLTHSGVPALGLLAVALPAPWLVRRSANESAPPRWLAAWIAGAAISPLEGAGLLIIPAVFALADLLDRRGERAPWLAAVAVAGQLALAVASDSWLRASDGDRTWRQAAATTLQRHDRVLTPSARRAHVLGERFGVVATHLTPANAGEALADARAAAARGTRIVLDDPDLVREIVASALGANAAADPLLERAAQIAPAP